LKWGSGETTAISQVARFEKPNVSGRTAVSLPVGLAHCCRVCWKSVTSFWLGCDLKMRRVRKTLMNTDEHQAESAVPALKRSASEREFLRALQRHIKDNGGKYPDWSGVLQVLRELGYERAGGSLP